MYEGKSHTLFAKYALPQMIGLLFNSVYMIVDGVFIGNRLGRDAMAAAAVSVPLVEILIALSMAVATGAGVLISSRLGRGEGGALPGKPLREPEEVHGKGRQDRLRY